jgi:ribonuclease D
LKHLYEWREKLALQLNKPSGSVMPTDILMQMAVAPAQQFSDWQNTKGMMGRIKDNHTFKDFRRVVQEAQQLARQENIPHTRPQRPRRPDFLVTRDEAERRKARLLPVRARLAELYGENVATILLPQAVVNEYAEGKALEIRKNYARQIVSDVLTQMQISLD